MLPVATGLSHPDDLLTDGDRLLVTEYGSSHITVLGDRDSPRALPGSIAEPEGMARIGDTLYVADQADDRIVTLAADGGVATFLQLQPVPGVDGVDGIATDGKVLIVPDSARGQVLWVGTDGQVQRRVTGFQRPVGAWAVPDGSTLIAEENGGRVWSIAADGSRSVVASGLPLADDVARTPDGHVLAISITLGTLVDIGAGAPKTLAAGFGQVQGLALDHAGNALVTDYDRGTVDAVVRTVRLAPPAAAASLRPNQPLCVRVVRAPGFADAVTIGAGAGYRVVRDIGTGSDGEVLPPPCAEQECAVQVRVRAGDRTDAAWLRYRSA